MASYYIVRRSNLTQGQVAQVGIVFFTFGAITASPLSVLLNRMISFFEPDFRLVHKQSVQLGGREFIQATWVQIGPEV